MLQSGELWTYLTDLNEQAQNRLEWIIGQMKAAEGITEALKASNPMAWVQHMNNIRTRAEEIRPRGVDLCMNMEEYVQALEIHVASRKLILGDGESVLSLLYEAYGDINPMYDDQIKADFAELYQALNGMPLQEMDWIINPVCSLRRDHERNGFVYGVQIGIRSALEGKITK